jgi:hypothetical protein
MLYRLRKSVKKWASKILDKIGNDKMEWPS